MTCKSASWLMVRTLLGDIAPAQKHELERHLARCAGCRERMDSYARIRRGICELEPEEPPGELLEACELAAHEARSKRGTRRTAPADPKPMRGGLYRAAVLAGALASVVLVNALILWLASGSYEARPTVGSALWLSGRAEISYSGGRSWIPLGKGTALAAGAAVRTGEDGLLKLKTDGAVWWLDTYSAISLTGPREALLLSGRCFLQRTQASGEPVRLESSQGTATCIAGSLVASVSSLRFFLTVVSGKSALTGSEGTPLEVLERQRAMAIQGHPVQPVRSTDPRLATHWLRRFEMGPQSRLAFEELDWLPLKPRAPALPDAVLVRDLALRVATRGPLAAASAQIELENVGDVPWRGVLDVGDIIDARRLCAVSSDPVEVLPGRLARVRSCAVVALRRRGERWRVSLHPARWTARPVGHFSLSFEGKATGGLSSAECLTHPLHLEREGREVLGHFETDDLAPALPVVIDLAFQQRKACDLAVFDAGDGGERWGVVSCRGILQPDGWAANAERYLFAFDATAAYGPEGRSYAHELVEALVNRVPAHATIAFVACDGAIRNLPEAARRYEAAKLERMLTALWSLPAGQVAAPGLLFRHILPAGAGNAPTVIFYVTGPEAEPPPLPRAQAGNARVVCAQVGVEEVREFYRSACSASGGGVVRTGLLLPEAAAARIFEDLKWAGLTSARVHIREGGRALKVLTRAGEFSNRPLLALVEMGSDRSLAGTFVATTAGGTARRSFELPTAEAHIPGVALPDKLLDELKNLAD